MTKRRKVNASKVIEAVESGRLSKDVMDSFGLEKPAPPIKSRRGRRRKSGEDGEDLTGFTLADVTITKRGSLVIPREVIEQLGFQIDDGFIVRKTKAGMILKPM
jgi:hypothetical protein